MEPLMLYLLLVLTGCVEDQKADPAEEPADDSSTVVEADADADGWLAGEDCNDAEAAINPDAAEVCNRRDDDCDGAVDEDAVDMSTWYTDGDGDGYGTEEVIGCELPAGVATAAGDCDDADAAFHPGAPESDCTDPSDYDCDGVTLYADADADGSAACVDCDEAAPEINPLAAEVCDDLDNDCDGLVDWGHRVPSDHPDIQSALDASADGDVICVEAGTYTGSIDFEGHEVSLVGTWGPELTILDGGGAGRVVTFREGETAAAVLSGFTVRNGHDIEGAGVYVVQSSPTLSDLVITGNLCDDPLGCKGVGLLVISGDPTIERVEATGNTSASIGNTWGVGAYFSSSDASISESAFDGNVATTTDPEGAVLGTGLSIEGGAPTFSGVTVDGNITELGGDDGGDQRGSVYVANATAHFSDVSVSLNEGRGGYNVWSPAVYEEYSTSTWTRVEIAGNLAETYYADTAGIRLLTSNSVWTNVIVAGNVSIAPYMILSAGAFVDLSGLPVLDNVAIVGNRAEATGSGTVTYAAGLAISVAGVTARNVAITGNVASSSAYCGGVYIDTVAGTTFQYSDVQGNTGGAGDFYGLTAFGNGTGNITEDPLYVDVASADPTAWDLGLQVGSPLLDAGDPALLDPDGSRSDIGALGGPEAGDWF